VLKTPFLIVDIMMRMVSVALVSGIEMFVWQYEATGISQAWLLQYKWTEDSLF